MGSGEALVLLLLFLEHLCDDILGGLTASYLYHFSQGLLLRLYCVIAGF